VIPAEQTDIQAVLLACAVESEQRLEHACSLSTRAH
jgi:hypothetical protein